MTAWKLVSILLLIAANAFFVAGEFALVSLRRTRIKEMVARGGRRAVSVQKAVGQLSLMLSGTQLGVTLTALGLGALGEPTLAHEISAWLPVFVLGLLLAYLYEKRHSLWTNALAHGTLNAISFVLLFVLPDLGT